MDFTKAFEVIEPAIFGIGYHDGPNFQIFGTGFVVHRDGWIVTNRHVLEPLLIKDANGNTCIRPDARALHFVVIQRSGGFACGIGYANSRILELRWIEQPSLSTPIDQRNSVQINDQRADLVLAPEAPDVGVCRIDLSLLPAESLPLKPVRIVSSRSIKVGTAVGILGYPQGLQGPGLSPSIMDLQCCPILQTGIVSAILPHFGFENPTQILLDILVNGGSSGSPLFSCDGDVLGVVFAAREALSQLIELTDGGEQKICSRYGVYTGTAIGCAVPSTAFIEKIAKVIPTS